MCHWIGSESESAVCRWGRYIRWRSFLPYEIRKARASRAGRKRERESDKEVGRRKRKAMKEGGIEGVVGQWSVNHRHGVMTRLSFQRLHRRKSSVRSYRPPSLSLSLPRVLFLFLFRNTLSPSERPLGFSYRNRYDGSRNPKDFTLKYCRK